MTFFLTALISNLVQITCNSAQTILVLIVIFFLISFNWLGGIDSNGQGRALSILLLLLAAVFLLFASSFCKRLYQVTGVKS